MTIIREQMRRASDGRRRGHRPRLAEPRLRSVSAWRVLLPAGSRQPRAHAHQRRGVRRAARERARRARGRGHELGPATACRRARRRFTIRNDGAEPFEAVCCMAAGGQAVVEGEGTFVPPWAA